MQLLNQSRIIYLPFLLTFMIFLIYLLRYTIVPQGETDSPAVSVSYLGSKQLTNTHVKQQGSSSRVKPESLADLVLRTVPETFEDYCEEVFTSAEFGGYNFSEEYHERFPDLEKMIKSIPDATNEGGSGSKREQQLMLHFLAQGPSVKTVCETGFNVGYSAFAYLSANPGITVYSFDLGRHRGTKPMVNYLKSVYGDRLKVHFGDSTETLLEFHQRNPEIKCDVILVDGGHLGSVPWTDIQNFVSKFAVPGASLLMFDDYPTRWGIVNNDYRVLAQSWQLAVHYKLVKELIRCTYKRSLHKALEKGFVVGLVTSSENLDLKLKW